MSSQTLKYHVQGMHCKACEMLLESELPKAAGVASVKASLASKEVKVVADSTLDPQTLAKNLTALVEPHGYLLTLEREQTIKKWDELAMATGIALLLGVLFLLLQRLGLASWISGDKLNYPLVFGIGLIASVSSCMAVVGGLLLSVSATWSKQNEVGKSKITPHLLFHLSRLISFFILGGFLGLIGTFFGLNPSVSTILNILVGFTMLVLGLNLIEIFDWTKKLQFQLPKFLTKGLFQTKFSHKLAPLLLGLATFFLPCGFTQSMQIYTLTSGSFLNGALIMLVFALGTLPMLGLISFSSFTFAKTKYAGIFFKTAGFLVISFALYNLYQAVQLLPLIF